LQVFARKLALKPCCGSPIVALFFHSLPFGGDEIEEDVAEKGSLF
jgi:hypothetical protein